MIDSGDLLILIQVFLLCHESICFFCCEEERCLGNDLFDVAVAVRNGCCVLHGRRVSGLRHSIARHQRLRTVRNPLREVVWFVSFRNRSIIHEFDPW